MLKLLEIDFKQFVGFFQQQFKCPPSIKDLVFLGFCLFHINKVREIQTSAADVISEFVDLKRYFVVFMGFVDRNKYIVQ